MFFPSQYHRNYDQLSQPHRTEEDWFHNHENRFVQHVFGILLGSERAFGFGDIGDRENFDPEDNSGWAAVHAC